MNNTNPQIQHYANIHDDYSYHYYDKWSMAYRNVFFYDVMFRGLDLNRTDVADLACGSGHNSAAILMRYPLMRVCGFDISEKGCNEYIKQVKRPCYQFDLTKDELPHQRFDVAFIIGGLHHCSINIDETIKNIANTIRPNGVFIMIEPSSDFFLQALRDFWYRKDHFFEYDSERALSHNSLLMRASNLFSIQDVTYGGGPGYFLIMNSLVFRLPKIIKAALSLPLTAFDKVYNRIPCRSLFPYFIARWRRK